MAHYAFLNDDNIVVNVTTGNDELSDGGNWELQYEQLSGLKCRRTSYNTYGGQHSSGGKAFRKNYAGIGFSYDAERDAFIPPQPFASWVLDEESCLWQAPVAYPSDGKSYAWNEATGSWDEELLVAAP
jgi:hypothetical protein